MPSRFDDVEILVGVKADVESYDDIERTLKKLGQTSKELDNNLQEANNRELRAIRKRITEYEYVKRAFLRQEASIIQLRKAHDALADSTDRLNEKGDRIRAGRAEEDLKAFERQAALQKKTNQERLDFNLKASKEEETAHVRKLNRINKEHQRQLHAINSTAARSQAAAGETRS